MKGKITTLLADENYNLLITIKVEKADRQSLREAVYRLRDGDIEFTLKKYVEHRSLSANAYMWVLVGKIAEKVNLPKNEVYRKHILEVGIYRPLNINTEAVATFETAWSKLGIGWITETVEVGEKQTLINAYYGSSSYNKHQMQRLLDSVIQDAESLGISVKTPDEIAKMVSLWETELGN